MSKTKPASLGRLRPQGPLLMPALRCKMGVWTYYVASMQLKEIAGRVVFATDLFTSEAYRDLLQRGLDPKRRGDIEKYILQNEQRFLGAMIVAVKGGDPQWFSINIEESPLVPKEGLDEETVDDLGAVVGFLRFSGAEELWALDGQHRLGGIKDAMRTPVQEAHRGDEQMPVIFVAHKTGEKGMKRTRRLFTTVNRNAKPINTGERIALDEDDACAILTRRLVEEHPLLMGDRTATLRKKSLPPSEKNAIVAITKIYDTCFALLDKQTILQQTFTGRKLLKDGPRPSDQMLDAMYEVVAGFWSDLAKQVADVAAYLKSAGDEKAVPFRHEGGGNLLFRGVGIDAFVAAFVQLRKTRAGRNDALRMLAKVPLNLDDVLWQGILWDPNAEIMLPKAANKNVAIQLLVRQAGGSVDEDKLTEGFQALKGPKATLPEKAKTSKSAT